MPVTDINILSGISHELHDTIILMNHSLERLEHTYPELQCYQYWQDTKENCGYMKSLATRLSIWQQAAGYNREPIQPEPLVRSLYLTCASLPEADKRRIIYCCHRNIPAICAVKKSLKTNLLALMRSRLAQSPEGSCLHIDLNHIGDSVLLRITDDGALPNLSDSELFAPLTYMTNQQSGTFCCEASPSGGCICTLTFPVMV